LRHGADLFDVVPNGEHVWGWRGRTVGSRVEAQEGAAWLRIAAFDPGDVDGDLWSGTRTAAERISKAVMRPRLLRSGSWTDDSEASGERYAYQAELTDFVESSLCSATSELRAVVELSDTWWASLRVSLEHLAGVRTDREVISQRYLDRAMPHYLDRPGLDTRPPAGWTAAHGDLHWANLTCDGPVLLDWEGWGMAPAGYDAALLAVHSMLVPVVEARVRRVFAHVLDSAAGRFAELVVIAELLQTAERGDNLDLAALLPGRAQELLGERSIGGDHNPLQLIVKRAGLP
jgi:hypothetical protein